MDALHRKLYEALVAARSTLNWYATDPVNPDDGDAELVREIDEAIEAYENEVCRCT